MFLKDDCTGRIVFDKESYKVKPQVKEYTEEEKTALTARLKQARAKQLAQN